MAIWRRTDTPIMGVPDPTNEHEWLADGDSDRMPLRCDKDCMSMKLINNDDLSNSWVSDNDFEEDFFIYAN